MSQLMKSPYPYFGGKSKVVDAVWPRFGTDCTNYVEPFFGSGAMLRGRPQPFSGVETVNDACGFIANFWRAIAAVPDEVAAFADWPVNENDLHARHYWLVERKESLQARLEGDPDFYDAKVAGWWVWGMACWIGSGFCSGQGPWGVVEQDGARQLVHLGDAGQGVNRQLVHLGNAGQGVNRQLVHLGDAGRGVNRKRVHLGNAGQGVNRKLVHLGNAGRGVNRKRGELTEYFAELSDRFAAVRVCCGDWPRVCTPTVTQKHGTCAVFLDPPYDAGVRCKSIYRVDDDTEGAGSIADACRKWCAENGDNPVLRIALCGYAGEGHEELDQLGWEVFQWKTAGGYSSQGSSADVNRHKERIWFSPHCLRAGRGLFD